MATTTIPAPPLTGPVPGSRVDRITNDRESLLLWVHSGTARVTTDLTHHELSAGEAVWVPPGLTHTVVVDEDSLALPIFVAATQVPGQLRRIVVLTIPEEWADWLVWRSTSMVGHLHGFSTDAAGVVELVAGSRVAADGRLTLPPVPPLPSSPEALSVAHAILSTPSTDSSVDELAAGVALSTRTLQRQFARETGMSLTRWRTAARVAVAAALLADGHHVGWARDRVGLHDAASFTRIFRRHVGLAPSRYARGLRDGYWGGSGAADLVGTVSMLAQGPGADSGDSPRVPTVPAITTWECVSGIDIAVWAYRGTARIRIGGRVRHLEQGDAVWLPADVAHSMELDEGAIVMPVEWRDPRGSGTESRIVRFPPGAELHLLHSLVSAGTELRPDRESGELLRALEAADPPPALVAVPAEHVALIAEEVRAHPADGRSLGAWAERLGVERAALRREFAAVTGETFEHWRSQLRMTIARELLDEGEPPAAVARRLGYAHPSGFNRVFAATFGRPPGAYQRSATA